MTAVLPSSLPLTPRAPSASTAATPALPPILYGYLGNGYEKGLGRQGGLTDALAQLTTVILLKRSPASPSSPKFRPTVQQLRENLLVVHNAFALRYSRLGRRIGKPAGLLDGRWLNTALAHAGIADYIYWLADSSPAMLWGMPTHRLVYDCYDPCFIPQEQPRVDKNEFAAARLAKIVFATAETLAARMRIVNPNVHLLPNACSTDTLHAPPAQADLPQLRDRPRPVVGCMSTYDWRFDADIVYHTARLLPDITFALVGRINADQQHRLQPLRSLPNVLLPGAVSYDDGLLWTSAFDIGLIPFLPGDISDAVNPVKMYMYLAAGKPVVSTHIHECTQNSFVRTARTPEQLAAAIRAAAADRTPESAARRIRFAANNRWQDRASSAARILTANGLAARRSATDGFPA
ncbi:MAG TPA: glycosyltransferase [Phycisphaerae bacterium]|nr:glycosyltransferase [Phycisphaerae bacterium]